MSRPRRSVTLFPSQCNISRAHPSFIEANAALGLLKIDIAEVQMQDWWTKHPKRILVHGHEPRDRLPIIKGRLEMHKSNDLMRAILTTHERLLTGTIGIDEANAESRILTNAVRLLYLEMAHAQETGRLERGSSVLPGFAFGEKPRLLKAESER